MKDQLYGPMNLAWISKWRCLCRPKKANSLWLRWCPTGRWTWQHHIKGVIFKDSSPSGSMLAPVDKWWTPRFEPSFEGMVVIFKNWWVMAFTLNLNSSRLASIPLPMSDLDLGCPRELLAFILDLYGPKLSQGHAYHPWDGIIIWSTWRIVLQCTSTKYVISNFSCQLPTLFLFWDSSLYILRAKVDSSCNYHI
jgi:hypothetical protein